MSDYFNMAFTEAADLGSAMIKAHDLVKSEMQIARVKQTIERNMFFVPSIRYGEANFYPLMDAADRNWLCSLFNYRFVFWPEHHLLGVVGDTPEELDTWFNFTFQDGTDQDYRFEEYPKLPFFIQEVEKAKSTLVGPKETVLQILKDNDWLDEDEEYDKNQIEYLFRRYFYREVYAKLHLFRWLYGYDDPVFERFTINGIETQEQAQKLSVILRVCKKDDTQ